MASSSTSYWVEAGHEPRKRRRGLTPEDAILIEDDEEEEQEEEGVVMEEEDDGLQLTECELMQMQSPGPPPLYGWQDSRIAALALAASPESAAILRDAATAEEYQRRLHEIVLQQPPHTWFMQGYFHPAAAWNTLYNPKAITTCTFPTPPAPPTPKVSVTQGAYIFDRVGGRLAKVGNVTVRMRGRFLWAGARAAEQAHWFNYSTSWGLDHSMAVVGVEIELNDQYRAVNSKEELVLPDCMSRMKDSTACFHSKSALCVYPFSRWVTLPDRDCKNFSDRNGYRTLLDLHLAAAPGLALQPQPQQAGPTLQIPILGEEETGAVPGDDACTPFMPTIYYDPVGPTVPSLPYDVMRNIQARLPLKTLFESLLVNKDWHHAMWTTDFRAMQREFGPKDVHLVLEFSFDYSVQIFDRPLDPDSKDPFSLDSSVAHGLTSAYYAGERSHGQAKTRYLQKPEWYQLTFLIPSGMRAVGHSKGLLCLMEASMIYLREDIPADLLPPVDHRLLMCDPLFNVKKWIAQPHVHPDCRHQEDFQLVGMVTYTNSPHYQLYAIYTCGPAQVYESVTDRWTITQAYVGAHCTEDEIGREEFGFGTVCNGSLYVLGRCVERSGFCRQHGILRCHILGCSRRSHSYSIYRNNLYPGAHWERKDLEVREGFNEACHALVEDLHGRLLVLSSMVEGGPAAVIWNLELESLELLPVARLEYQTLNDWGFTVFQPEMWFQASDGLIYITLNNIPQLLVADLSGYFAEWWWMPPSPLNLLYRGLHGRYAAMPVCPRMDAFLSKLGPTLEHPW